MTSHLNVEIKAVCRDPQSVLRRLESLGAEEQGVDHQIDTYFAAAAGRLKVRQGSIENYLIHYVRNDQPGPKDSRVTLHEVDPHAAPTLLALLTAAVGVTVTVDKRRHILWIDNVKFHVDTVAGLGDFLEIEAIDLTGAIGRDRLLRQCQDYIALLGVEPSDLEPRSYSDLLRTAAQEPSAPKQPS